MENRRPAEAGSKIKAFLHEHRTADVVVCTGYVSVNGLAWLSRQVDQGRGVTLVIGDMRAHFFANASDGDRKAAAAFLRRDNVKVHHWYRQKPVKKIAHGKAVVAVQGYKQKPVAALVGSANLTDQGLHQNLELMVRCDTADLGEIEAYVAEATRHPPANDKLIGFVVPDKSQDTAGKGGCLPALALIPAHTAASLWARIRMSVITDSHFIVRLGGWSHESG